MAMSPALLTTGAPTTATSASFESRSTAAAPIPAALGRGRSMDNQREWAVESCAETLGEQIIGPSLSRVRRLATVVGQTKLHPTQWQRHGAAYEDNGNDADPRPGRDQTGPPFSQSVGPRD